MEYNPREGAVRTRRRGTDLRGGERRSTWSSISRGVPDAWVNSVRSVGVRFTGPKMKDSIKAWAHDNALMITFLIAMFIVTWIVEVATRYVF